MTRATAAGDAAAAREPYWDNAKAVLVTLVVVGHAVQPAAAAGVVVADVLYRWVYLFHMPAFVLLTGMLTGEPNRRRAARLLTGLLVPYVLFQALQTAEHHVLTGAGPPVRPLEPRWTLWFLVAVVLWRLSAPLWQAMRPAVALAVAVALMVVAGLGPGVGHVLALDDALGFLPFFVAGLLLPRSALASLAARPRVRWAAAVVLVAAAAGVALTRGEFSRAALQPGFSTQSLGTDPLTGSVLRLLLLGASAVAVAAVLALVPSGARRWTGVGAASMYVYLLHAPLLLPLRDGRWVAGTALALLTALAAVLLALLLGSRPVQRVTRWAVEPRWADALLAGDLRSARPARPAAQEARTPADVHDDEDRGEPPRGARP
ncbi:acyltransferase family protein [Cellulomonas massiliensis]|uniref:acyltransferase family protein n=1 Tax=Cellulomonas massiliensis TaxID=1465811 RepID=UPI000370B4FB|nr:acyltransferase family protein [Cellulomonas massiliensis]